MFNRFTKSHAEVIDHWYALIPGFNMPGREFYAAVEAELKTRQVPGLETLFVDFAEGGVLSAKREYLRMTRERLVFDVCAAPFGTAYFFSCRFAEIPAQIKISQLLVLLVLVLTFVAMSVEFFGIIKAVLIVGVTLGFLVYVLRNAVAMGLRDLDAFLVKERFFGPIYERFFRKETYYRLDTRLMYRDTVNAVIKEKLEDITGAKGIKYVCFNEYSPFLGDLYKSYTVTLPRQPK